MSNFYKDKQDIINWLYKHGVKNYTLVLDEKYGFVVDVDADVILSFKNLLFIPVKFNNLDGNFSCSNNKLKDLEFSPEFVIGDFNCCYNEIVSLEFSPKVIKGSFRFYYNQVKSLEFIPEVIGKDLNFANNSISSLKNCPEIIHGDFNCNKNFLDSLEYSPKTVVGSFLCQDNEIKSLLFCPENVGGGFYCDGNFELNLLEHITDFNLIYNEFKILNREKFANKLDNSLSDSEISKPQNKIKL